MDALDRIDLNCLRTLALLLESGSVSEAARRAGIGQPAMSRRLAELRRVLRDPLLVPAGRRSTLSEHAEALRPRVQEALSAVTHALQAPQTFDPVEARFEVRIGANDYASNTLIAPWWLATRARAPGLALRVDLLAEASAQLLSAGDLDFVIAPALSAHRRDRLDRFVARPLFRDHYVCAMRPGHPFLRRRKPRSALLDYEHLRVRCGAGDGVLDAMLAKHGYRPQIVHSVPSFLMALAWVEGSDGVAVLPARLAACAGERLRARLLPFVLRPFTIYLAWHPRSNGSARHRWLRQSLLGYERQPPEA